MKRELEDQTSKRQPKKQNTLIERLKECDKLPVGRLRLLVNHLVEELDPTPSNEPCHMFEVLDCEDKLGLIFDYLETETLLIFRMTCKRLRYFVTRYYRHVRKSEKPALSKIIQYPSLVQMFLEFYGTSQKPFDCPEVRERWRKSDFIYKRCAKHGAIETFKWYQAYSRASLPKGLEQLALIHHQPLFCTMLSVNNRKLVKPFLNPQQVALIIEKDYIYSFIFYFGYNNYTKSRWRELCDQATDCGATRILDYLSTCQPRNNEMVYFPINHDSADIIFGSF